jgi:cell division transport system ATP-binding protein
MIEFKNISKVYGKNIWALKNISFRIERGEFVTIVGPSGAGKSTLIRLLICEERPTSGEIYVAGREITHLSRRELPFYRRKIGVIFQDFKLLPQKTVAENVAFALEVSDASPGEIARKVPLILDLVGLSNRMSNKPDELSGGEKQRVSIARALVHTPKILIADEPTGNLDPLSTWEIIELLFKINKRGTTVILATHDKEIVDTLNKRVITIKNGQLVSDQQKGKYIL